MINIQQVLTHLPPGVESMQSDALSESCPSVERLVEDWESETERYSQPDEMLVALFLYDELAGVGGITNDPCIPMAMRIRICYVRPYARGVGVGRALVTAITSSVKKGKLVTVHADTTDAEGFFDAMQFLRSTRDGISHERIWT